MAGSEIIKKKYRVWDAWRNKMRYGNISLYCSFDDDGTINSSHGSGDNVLLESSGILAQGGVHIYQGDVVKDTLTKMCYEVRLGFCKKFAFTGWYLISMDGDIYACLNADEDSDGKSASYLKVIGDVYSKDFKSLLV